MKLGTGFSRLDSPHTDELLFDPLPQPYRFINKILVQTIESAIDLAEDGGSAEALNAFVCHNLRLTKVGKIPTLSMDNYLLSTTISPNEITCYSIFADTRYLIAGNNQGVLTIFNVEEKQILFTYTASSISKFATGPITHILSFKSDHDVNVVVFTCEESLIILFISQSFALRGQMEVDISSFLPESLEIEKCIQPYIYITDGTGRTLIYNCTTPADICTPEQNAGAKGSVAKTISLEPIFECEKCLISNGPVNSEQGVTLKIDDPTTRKKGQRKKAPATGKGGKRVKSPGSITAEAGQPVEMTRYNSTCIVHDDMILVYFESFNILILYCTQPTLEQVCDFSLPSKLTSINELREGIVGLGFENGSFCLLNIPRRSITCHMFQKRGAITGIKAMASTLFTFTVSKNTTAYQFDGRRVGNQIFSLSDEDVLDMKLASKCMITYNGRPSDLGLCNALMSKVEWAERNLHLVPNISCVDESSGKYLGTIKTPANLEVIDTLWSDRTCIMIYKDPKDYLVPATKLAPLAHGKRGTSPKGRKEPAKRGTKLGKGVGSGNATSKKFLAEEIKDEPEPMIVQRRELIGFIKLDEAIEKFEKTASSTEKAAEDRRLHLKSISQKSIEL